MTVICNRLTARDISPGEELASRTQAHLPHDGT